MRSPLLFVCSTAAFLLLLLAVASGVEAWTDRSDGYHGKDSLAPGGPSYDFVDISTTGNVLAVGEDSTSTANSAFVDLPSSWKFPYFGADKDKFKVNNNGGVIFGTSSPSTHPIRSYYSIPGHPANDVLSVWWAHVRAKPVYYEFFDTPEKHLIIQWDEHDDYFVTCYPVPLWTFQVKMFEDGDVEYHYKSANRDHSTGSCSRASATIGIEDSTGTKGVEYPITTTVNPDMTGRAIKFWINRAPEMDAVAPLTVLEDASVSFTASATDADDDSVTYALASGPSDGTVTISGSTITYTPDADFSGTDSFEIEPEDWWEAGDTVTIDVTVRPVNDEPALVPGADVLVLEDAGVQTVTGWATGIKPGPASESAQTLTITATPSKPLFSSGPSIDGTSGTLSFTPAPDAYGNALVTVRVQDDGGTADGGDDTFTTTFWINITAVNDAPAIQPGPNVGVLEDSGAHTATWASGIAPGPANEAAQHLDVTIHSNDPSLFSVQPALTPSGVLSFTPAPGAFGSSLVTVTLEDDGGTENGGTDTTTVTFAIEVLPVNDAPTITPGGDVTVDEDHGPYSATWATGVAPGPANEASQSLFVHVVAGDPALFSSAPAMSPAGVLTFRPAADAFGSTVVTVTLQDDGGTADGGTDTTTTTFTVTVRSVNDRPRVAEGDDVVVLEDAGPQELPWTAPITAGPANEDQDVEILLSHDADWLFASGPVLGTDGRLAFEPAPGVSGATIVKVLARDDGGRLHGGQNTTVRSFTLEVLPVNDPPAMTPGGDIEVLEDAGPFAAVWATGIGPGGANESSQTTWFDVEAGDASLFTSPPAIDAAGVLRFTPAPDLHGTTDVVVRLRDGGGTADGGADSTVVTFTLRVLPVNDAPRLDALADQHAMHDEGPVSVTGFITGVVAGPPDESGQSVDLTVTVDDAALFEQVPWIDGAGTLHFEPRADGGGTAVVEVEAVDDGGTANGGMDRTTRSFRIVVTGAAPTVDYLSLVERLPDTRTPPVQNHPQQPEAEKENRPPVPVLDAPDAAGPGPTVLDASRSTDPDQDLLRYTWRVHDGVLEDADRAVATFTPGGAGTYLVELTVSDGVHDVTTRHALEVRPAAGVGFDVAPDDEDPLATAFAPHGDGPVTWDFGDGTTSTEPAPHHRFPAPGTYVVRMVQGDQVAVQTVHVHEAAADDPGTSKDVLLIDDDDPARPLARGSVASAADALPPGLGVLLGGVIAVLVMANVLTMLVGRRRSAAARRR